MGGEDKRLDALRHSINAVDDELLALLNKRAALVEEVAEHKQTAGLDFYVPGRERAIIDRLLDDNAGPFPSGAIRPVFQEVISACLSLEKGVKVAYLGPETTFTHQAVKRHFGTSAVNTMPCGSISSVFDEVSQGRADFGVVPVENSTEGVVNHTLDCFLDSEVKIAAEILVKVDHCLMTRPGMSEADIRHVYSHPQAFAQCRNWLNANLPNTRLIEVASTADAARQAQQDGAGAAIAAELAARGYRLQILRRQLQDIAENVTRFLVLSGEDGPATDDRDHKTSLLLVLNDEAGHLHRVVKPLAEAGINLTKIESRPSRRQIWDYVFFLDLDGHRTSPTVAPVLAELEKECALFKVLGSYRKADAS